MKLQMPFPLMICKTCPPFGCLRSGILTSSILIFSESEYWFLARKLAPGLQEPMMHTSQMWDALHTHFITGF